MTEEVITPVSGTEPPAAVVPPTVTPPTVTPPQDPPAPEKTFSQADLEYQIKERLKREREKYADYEALKAAAAKLQEIEDSQKTETQKLADKMAELEKRLSDSEAAKLQLEEQVTVAKRDARAAQIAISLGAIDTHDANILAAISMIDGDSEAEMKTAIENLKKAKPYLFAGPMRLEAFNPGTATGGAQTDRQVVDELYRHRASGKTPF